MRITASKKPRTPSSSVSRPEPAPRTGASRRFDWLCAIALGILALVLTVMTSGIGITYDEPVYAGEAMRVRSWMEAVLSRIVRGEISALLDPSLIQEHWRGKDMQPSLLKIAIATMGPIAENLVGGLSAYRAATAVFFALMIAATYLFGVFAENRLVGGFAALSLFFLPHVFAHAHLMSLDIPVAAMTVLTTLLFFLAVTHSRALSFVAAGIALGLALGAKMNAILILPSVVLWLLLRRTLPAVNALLLVGMSGAIGFVAFFLSWPYLWLQPVSHLLAYARFHFQHYPVHVSYFGKIYDYAPWHYPLVMIAITTPLLTLALMVGGALFAVRTCRLPPFDGRLLWLTSAGFQLLAFVNPGTPKYNGVRLFLAVFPFLCLLAGLAFAHLATGMADRLAVCRFGGPVSHFRAKCIALLFVLALLPGLRDTVDSHPFGMSFYNAAVGGTRGAVRRGFEPTYWGDAFVHVMPFLREHAPQDATVSVIPGTVVWLFDYYRHLGILREDLRVVDGDVERADYVVFHARQSEMTPLAKRLLASARPAFAVRYAGATLAAVVTGDEARRAAGVKGASSTDEHG